MFRPTSFYFILECSLGVLETVELYGDAECILNEVREESASSYCMGTTKGNFQFIFRKSLIERNAAVY